MNKKKVPCTITLSYLVNLWRKQRGRCYYSGLPMTTKIYGTGRQLLTATMDRKDPTKGYVKRNIVLCCWAANAGKAEGTAEQFIDFCKAVVANQQ